LHRTVLDAAVEGRERMARPNGARGGRSWRSFRRSALAQYLVLAVLIAVVCAVTAFLLLGRLADAGVTLPGGVLS
jgi:hypothetical protein